MAKTKKDVLAIQVGRNEPHMKYVQESRRSNECGFHGPNKRQRNRKERRKAKLALRKYY